MKTTYLFIAGLISLSTNAVFAAETTTPVPKTRAEVVAELAQARAQGEEVGMEGMIWYEAQKAELAKANAAKKETAKADKK
ncbi:DUF4148 domain-containing protein [Undibacterium sp. FT147W]|uniref:DUF4148 domain-containing protein n=1 Tax=Undibacterium rivi TaxID=2828729 RepID=A0ABS5H5Q0_9BURK|nr:DUF4148 domain-containing protein [Undibacterium rivi]MBR7794198.1 DUF4148 domain-containing protein [Undibacterium rivi]